MRLAAEADLEGFRQHARALMKAGVAPEAVRWTTPSSGAQSLLEDPPIATASPALPAMLATPTTSQDNRVPATGPGVPPSFLTLCAEVICHRDPARFALLYRLLWRYVHEEALRSDPLDPDRIAAEQMARSVRRDKHKMKAFVRFRRVDGTPEPAMTSPANDSDDALATFDPPRSETPAPAWAPTAVNPSHTLPTSGASASLFDDDDAPSSGHAHGLRVAWFEPEHHIVEAVAPFFARRFAQMRWIILTPEGSVCWDGQALAFGPGASRGDAPPADAGESLWLTYYEHIFNPARLKTAAMEREMPRRYWSNLPEARLIAPLVAGAAQRSSEMIAKGPTQPTHRRPRAGTVPITPIVAFGASTDAPASLAELARAIDKCRECPIGEHATQGVPGEGPPAGVRLLFVGEQPGDQEDLRGRPFVGPAGQLLDRAFGQLGWPRDSVYVTNAVKHFKFEVRGKRRVHKTPAQQEMAACLHWLDREIELVRPQALVALGATAARQLLGRAVPVMRERGQWLVRDDGLPVLVTLHPSALLRADPAHKDAAYDAWLADLRQADRYIR